MNRKKVTVLIAAVVVVIAVLVVTVTILRGGRAEAMVESNGESLRKIQDVPDYKWETLSKKNIYFGHHKPFILYGSHWWEIIDVIRKNMNIDDQEMSCFKIVESKEEVLKAIEGFEWEMEQIDHTHCKVCAEKAFMT